MKKNRSHRTPVRRVFLLIAVLVLVFSCAAAVHAAGQLYWGVGGAFATFTINPGETTNGIKFFTTNADDRTPITGGSFTFPPCLSAVEYEPGRWEVTCVGAAGDTGVITCTVNGETYRMNVKVRVPKANNNSPYGSWDGVNYTPAESEIRERAQLWYKPDASDTRAESEMLINPDIYFRGLRFFTFPATEKQYDCIESVTGWSFPDFVRMELDRGGQWNYRSDGAVVGQTGTATFFKDGVLYSMPVRVVDPWYLDHPEEEVSLPENAVVHTLAANAEDDEAYLADETIGELIDHFATDEEKAAIAKAEETASELELTTVPVADESEADRTDVSLVEQEIDTDKSLLDWYELSLSLVVKNARNGVTLARNIPVSEIRNGIRIELGSDLIGRARLRVVAVHNGEVIEIPIVSVDVPNRKLAFFADRFSTYAIVGETEMRVTYLDKALTVPYGGTFEAPQDAEKEGYTLTGWFRDEALTEPFDFTSPVTDDVTIWPAYEEIPKPAFPVWTVVGGIAVIAVIGVIAAVALGKKKKNA